MTVCAQLRRRPLLPGNGIENGAHSKLGARWAAAVFAAALIASCANWPGDEGANHAKGAPTFEGLGTSTFAVTTRSDEARDLFRRGLLLAYAFEHEEAARAFRVAAARDPDCAICAWGVAYALGPNINQSERRNLREIRRYLAQARAAADRATPLERALIEALSVRYGSADERTQKETQARAESMCATRKPQRDVDPLELAYAQAMTDMLARFPDDPDVVTLYADAVMTTSPWDWWDVKSGAANGAMADVVARLRAATQKHTDHTGAAHFLIHAAEQSPAPEQAEAAADRLGKLAPGAPHLVHMPSHIYVHTGRFADAVRVNQDALAQQQKFTAQIKSQGFTSTFNWDFHHLNFLWYAALVDGRAELALDTAQKMSERWRGVAGGMGEYVHGLPYLTLVRLQRWDRILATEAPAQGLGFAEGTWSYARGVALARKGQIAQARAAQARLDDMAALPTLKRAQVFGDALPADLLAVAADVLRGEIARAGGDHVTAIEALRRAADKDDEIGGEPPRWGAGARLHLASALVAAGRPADAEREYREHLRRQRDNGWALQGLQTALQRQGKQVDAAALAPLIESAWRNADAGFRPAL